MKRLVPFALLLFLVPAFAADPAKQPSPDLHFPDVVVPSPPAPPAPPAAVTTLNADEIYVITSDSTWLILDSPTGTVTITSESGPLRLRGRFAGGSGKVETRTYHQKQVTIIEPLVTGRVELICVPAGATTKADVLRKLLDVNAGPRPPPGPGPTPTPPGPTPGPAPIPGEGLRVLVVYETADVSRLPQSQLNVLYSKEVRDYLSAKCVKGPDGKTAEWRFWDANVNTANESKVWQDAMARPRTKLPWIVISTGKAGYEGPLPLTIDETLKLLKQYGG